MSIVQTVSINLTEYQFKELSMAINEVNKLCAQPLADALDEIFNGYLWSQHVNGSNNFKEAQSLHYDVMTVKKVLQIIEDPINEALKIKNQ
ncbi:hypothetical protein [Agriterribacter sp.]|uniref:hypothetical protein n=1 Tax=Agriterribacter sp. TaxID=2821509 RepID=UPI002CD793AC|nr:hypothetical protein [Agriterribacter sp.]HRO47681.1 hypothetical protein [Agriterribacter sp.]HRQ17662.1 hypothetical protein [Agriterribacter sp.]